MLRRIISLAVLTAIAGAGAGPALCQIGAPWSPPPPRPAAPTVVDAKGKFVGLVAGPGVMMRQSQGVWYQVNISNTAIGEGNVAPILYFASKDCTGAPFMNPDGPLPTKGQVQPSPRQPSPNFVADVAIYFASGPRSSKSIGSQSFNLANCYTYDPPEPRPVSPALVERLTGFTGPFSLK